jgi:hypothetical protein
MSVVTEADKAECRRTRQEFDLKIAAQRRDAVRRLGLRLRLPDHVVQQYFDNPDAT